MPPADEHPKNMFRELVQSETITSLLGYNRLYQLLIIEQSLIGWGHVFHGIISKHWCTL